MNTFTKAITLLLVTCFATGCGSTEDTTTSSSAPSGTLKGAVSLLDTTGQQSSDKSGVKVELLGTSYLAISNSDGVWSIPNLPSRTYTLCYSKPGYDTIKSQFAFLGGETVWIRNTTNPIILFHKPVFTAILDLFILPIDSYIDSLGQEHGTEGSIAGHFSQNAPAKTALGAEVILGKNPSLDIKNSASFDTMFVSNNGLYVGKYNTSDEINVTTNLHSAAKQLRFFHSGDTIYCRIYPFISTTVWDPSTANSTKAPSSYVNPEDQQRIYYGVGEGSNVLSVVMK